MLPPSFLPFWMEAGVDGAPPREKQRPALFFFLVVCGIAALYASSYAPADAGGWGWYPRLAKPAWILPPSVTGPVSALFYLILAISIWRIWRTGAFRNVPFTIAGFALLLFLQSIWSTLFYGLHSPLLGLLDLAVMAPLAAVLWLTYKPIDRIAAHLWLLYLLWIVILLPAHAAIWWLNG